MGPGMAESSTPGRKRGGVDTETRSNDYSWYHDISCLCHDVSLNPGSHGAGSRTSGLGGPCPLLQGAR